MALHPQLGRNGLRLPVNRRANLVSNRPQSGLAGLVGGLGVQNGVQPLSPLPFNPQQQQMSPLPFETQRQAFQIGPPAVGGPGSQLSPQSGLAGLLGGKGLGRGRGRRGLELGRGRGRQRGFGLGRGRGRQRGLNRPIPLQRPDPRQLGLAGLLNPGALGNANPLQSFGGLNPQLLQALSMLRR